MPPSLRSLANPSRGRVSSLWTYAWWPVSHRIRSLGLSNTRWSARVSSTTPRLGPRWPPVLETVATRNCRISSARARKSTSLRERRSAGSEIRSRTGVLETLSIFDSSLAKSRHCPPRRVTEITEVWFLCPLTGLARLVIGTQPGLDSAQSRGSRRRQDKTHGDSAHTTRVHAADSTVASAA